MARARGQRIRPERVSEQLRADVATILQSEVKDPRVGLVTCTRVDLSGDLRFAKLYVSVLGDDTERDETMAALERATGFVRRRLAGRLGLRVSPEIRFVFDPSIEYSVRLEALIEETKKNAPPAEEDGSDDDGGDVDGAGDS